MQLRISYNKSRLPSKALKLGETHPINLTSQLEIARLEKWYHDLISPRPTDPFSVMSNLAIIYTNILRIAEDYHISRRGPG